MRTNNPISFGAIPAFNHASTLMRTASDSASAVLNVGVLHELSIDWAMAARAELDTYDLIAGSGLAGRAPDQSKSIFDDSPDVRVSSFPVLLAEGALHPRPPVTPEEMQRVRTALGLPNP